MKINVKSIVKGIAILVILTVLPIIGRQWIPTEFYRAISSQSGFDLTDLLNRIAVIGAILAVLIVLRGHVEKLTTRHLALSTAWKGFWLFMVFFVLGLGYPETLGLAVLEGKSEAAENIVTFDFRLFAVLASVIVVLMIARSVMQFQEAKATAASQEHKNKSN